MILTCDIDFLQYIVYFVQMLNMCACVCFMDILLISVAFIQVIIVCINLACLCPTKMTRNLTLYSISPPYV